MSASQPGSSEVAMNTSEMKLAATRLPAPRAGRRPEHRSRPNYQPQLDVNRGGPDCGQPGMLKDVVDWARVRRVTRRQLAEVRRELGAAEAALAEAQAALKEVEGEYDAANDQIAAAERAP
jgi:hypothetical protein